MVITIYYNKFFESLYTFAYIPSKFLDGFFFFDASSSIAEFFSPTKRDVLPNVALLTECKSVPDRFSRDT